MICTHCGETMSGDGFKTVLHCLNASSWHTAEPDANPIHCSGDSEDTKCDQCGVQNPSDIHSCKNTPVSEMQVAANDHRKLPENAARLIIEAWIKEKYGDGYSYHLSDQDEGSSWAWWINAHPYEEPDPSKEFDGGTKCAWRGFETELNKVPGIIGGVKCTNSVCPTCGCNSYSFMSSGEIKALERKKATLAAAAQKGSM